MREKFLPRRLAFLIIVRGRGQREILKNPRPTGSWQPFKSIFGERKKDRPQRAGSPALSVLCAGRTRQGQVCGSLQSKFLPRCQNPQFCGFAPRGKLVGECLPQTLLWRLAPQNISATATKFLGKFVRCKVRGCLEPARPHRKNFKRSRTNAEKMSVVK